MNKRFLTTCVAALAAGCLSGNAQTASPPPAPPAQAASASPAAPAAPAAPAPPSLSILFEPTFVSNYMFRGQRLGGPSLEPQLEFDYDTWAVGVWSNTPIANKVPGQSDPEIDPYATYTVKINDSFSVVPGFTWYNYPRAPKDQGFYRSTFEPNLSVNYTSGWLTITPEMFYDVVLSGPTYQLQGTFNVPMKDLGSEFDFTAQYGTYKQTDVAYNTSPKVKAWGNYWFGGVVMPWTLAKTVTLKTGVAYTKGTDAFFKQGTFPRSANTGAVGKAVISVQLVFTF